MTNEELVQEYQNGNNHALDELMQQNTGLVMYFANKYNSFGQRALFEQDDLVQEGWIGFIDAVDKYDPNRKLESEESEPTLLDDEELEKTVLFSSYAGRAIQNKILRAINKNIPRKKKSDTYSEQIMVNSINALLPGSDGTTLEVMIPDDEAAQSFEDVENKMDNEALRQDLLYMLDSIFGGEFQYTHNGHDLNGVENVKALFDKLLNRITPKEVLLLHYGMFEKEMTHKEIGQLVNVSSSRIEQIEFKGLNTIRKSRPGKEFIKKYELDYVEELEKRKESIYQYRSPDKVVSEMELIDEMLKKYL